MWTRVLAVVAIALAALVVHQYNTIDELRSEVAATQTRSLTDAQRIVADSMRAYTPDVQKTMEWLHGFYKDRDGLQRPDGLWIDGHPDFQGLAVWVFDA